MPSLRIDLMNIFKEAQKFQSSDPNLRVCKDLSTVEIIDLLTDEEDFEMYY